MVLKADVKWDNERENRNFRFYILNRLRCFRPTRWRPVSIVNRQSQIANTLYASAYETNIYLIRTGTANYTVYAQQRYVTSSGEIHWLFILRDYATGQVLNQWQAPDHPCFGNGGKPQVTQHPWPDVFEENGALYRFARDPDTRKLTDQKQRVEIIVVNPSLAEVEEIEKARLIADEDKPDLAWLEAYNDLFEINESKSADWPDVPVTVGLPKTDAAGNIIDDYRFAPKGTKITPVKKVIQKPTLIEVAAINRKPGQGK